MPTAAMKPFKIFRPGKHTAACGTVIEFTEADLTNAVKAYNPDVYATPLVIGHPKTEDRAYGWAASLSYAEGHVWVNPEHVEPQFAEMVESKAFRNRSASWYMPDHPSNPVPGTLYPKHIGFLGAMPPSLKGLGDVKFNEGSAPVDFSDDPRPDLVLEFADLSTDDTWAMASAFSGVARAWRKFRDMVIADKGLEEADKLLPDWEIADAERNAMRLQERAVSNSKTQAPAYNEAGAAGDNTPTEGTVMTPEEIAAMKAENARLAREAASFAEREEAVKKSEHTAKVARISANLQPLVDQGKLLPAQRPQVAAFMATLDDSTQVVEFGEAVDGKVPSVSALAFMESFLKGLPTAVDFSERSSNNNGKGNALSAREIGEKTRKVFDEAAAAGNPISFSEASQRVCAEYNIEQVDSSSAPNV